MQKKWEPQKNVRITKKTGNGKLGEEEEEEATDFADFTDSGGWADGDFIAPAGRKRRPVKTRFA